MNKEKLQKRISNREKIYEYIYDFESQEGTFPDACIATNFSLNENGDIM
jgi:hypothetical protein